MSPNLANDDRSSIDKSLVPKALELECKWPNNYSLKLGSVFKSSRRVYLRCAFWDYILTGASSLCITICIKNFNKL
jgi:hypothetical protein